ncbi:MAG: hypothetical protein FJY67_11690 [Calditrichaeota bacterium]|nr:hypothetical protein [Calditrichota bacterium]
MNERYQYLSLAALLHDIGKLGQRAHESGKGLSSESARLEDLICPFNRKGRYRSHKHVLYTHEFILLVKDHLPSAFNITELALLASRHHQPESDDDHLLARADHLASGLERPAVEDAYGERQSSAQFRRIRLNPIAARICIEEPSSTQKTHVVAEWDDRSSVLFPQQHVDADLTSEMQNLWEVLLTKVKAYDCRDFWSFYSRLYSDMEATIWSVPAATNIPDPDVSLFDHSRAVSVIAGCLTLAEDQGTPFILVAGDFSGIQSFIYDLKYVVEAEDDMSRKGFARRLRGRSLGVRLFTEQAALHFLKRQRLTVAHRIMSAGGKLYLLLPNRSDIRQELVAMQYRIEEWSLNRSHGRIRFNFASLSLTDGDLVNFPETISRLNSDLAETAQRSLSRVLMHNHWQSSQFLLPQIEPEQHETSGDPFKEIDQDWGTKLPKSQSIAMMLDRESNQPLPFASLRMAGAEQSLPETSDQVLLLKGEPPSGRFAYQRSRIARYVPTDTDGDLLTFEKIAAKAKGRQALGFIKADVDNLGKLFRFGFRNSDSFSHVATLSRMLEGFFGGYVEELVSTEFPHIYLVYSGGDDLAAVGPWDQAIAFILKLREEFMRFTCGNKHWGFSAGICIGHHHMPILAAMEEAGRLLDDAKDRTIEDGHRVKDALCVFGEVLSWQTAAAGMQTGIQIMQWMDEDQLSTGQVRRLLEYASRQRLYARTHNNNHLRYITDLVWDLKRNWKLDSESLKWAQQLLNPACEEFQWLNFSLQYALMAARNKET